MKKFFTPISLMIAVILLTACNQKKEIQPETADSLLLDNARRTYFLEKEIASSFVAGAIVFDKECQGENCERMLFRFYQDNNYDIYFSIISYSMDANYLPVSSISNDYQAEIFNLLRKECQAIAKAPDDRPMTYYLFNLQELEQQGNLKNPTKIALEKIDKIIHSLEENLNSRVDKYLWEYPTIE